MTNMRRLYHVSSGGEKVKIQRYLSSQLGI